jgi:hypothetical protein
MFKVRLCRALGTPCWEGGCLLIVSILLVRLRKDRGNRTLVNVLLRSRSQVPVGTGTCTRYRYLYGCFFFFSGARLGWLNIISALADTL